MPASRVVVGHDARASSPMLKSALIEGLRSQGTHVVDLGLCGSEEVYFGTGFLGVDGGLMVTGSHNPADENGLKFVGPESRPLHPELEFDAIKQLVGQGSSPASGHGSYKRADIRDAYAACVASFVDPRHLHGVRVLADPGNGAAAPTFAAVAEVLSNKGSDLDITWHRETPDPEFPDGVPNPLLPANRASTTDALRRAGCDLALAWDGDFDRCFFFDAEGRFVDGEYIVALLARTLLSRHPEAKIVHDCRVTCAVTEAVVSSGGHPVASPTGHVPMKANMRDTSAVYGGELSGHHYFRDFYFCDSGIIPALLVLEELGRSGVSLKELVAPMRHAYPSSGEINFLIDHPEEAIERLVDALGNRAEVDRMDGASLLFDDSRVNLRASKTEGYLRLNVEGRGSRKAMASRLSEIESLLFGMGARKM